MKVLLDTNVCIHFMKNTHPRLTERLLSHEPDDLLLSAITVYELEYGASKSKMRDIMQEKLVLFLAPFTILPFTADDAMTAGWLRAHLEQQGTPIGPYDLQIAAQALSRGLSVVTHNTGEFRCVPNLTVEDWAL